MRHLRTLPALLLSLLGGNPLPSVLPQPEERSLTVAPTLAPTAGGIPVLMYHDISCPNTRFSVCPQDLYVQLAFMHERGFRAVTIDEYLREDFSRLAEREKPYLITFDDSPKSQLFFDETNQPSSQSAVGVIEAFRTDYAVRVPAIFFAITGKPIFDDALHEQQKLRYLVEHDFALGNHTAAHTNLTGATVEATVRAFARADASLDYLLGEYWGASKTGAFPYGALPSDSVRDKSLRALGYAALFHAYGGTAKQAGTAQFDNTAINRYETINVTDQPGGIQFLLQRFPIVRMQFSEK